jgi:hypothetical protein
MSTLSLHLMLATALVAHQLSLNWPSAAERTSVGVAPSIGLIVVILAAIFLAAMIRAAHAMANLMSQFLRIATEMTSVLFTLTLVIIVAGVLIAHH